MEIFGIPVDQVDPLKRAIDDAYSRYLYKDNGAKSKTLIKKHEGTCPFTGNRWIHVLIDGLEGLELKDVSRFQDAIYGVHPLRSDPVVADNAYLKLEDVAAAEEEEEAAEEGSEEELACWVCSRVDGEEAYDYDTGEAFTIEVRYHDDAKVPLCNVCLELFLYHDEWEDEGEAEEGEGEER
jgi:hypothetical protein